MKVWSNGKQSLYLLNFSPAEREGFTEGATIVLDATVGKYGFGLLRSDEIYVFRNMFDSPRYLSEPAAEFISIQSEGNFPSQFTYQFAHEMGHLMAQSWRRHRKVGSHSWLEEAICGAYSIYCLREALNRPGSWFQQHLPSYFVDYIEPNYRPVTIDVTWYNSFAIELAQSDHLTPTIKLLSRLIADTFPRGSFVQDNKALLDVPLNPDVSRYLQDWESACSSTNNVPKLFRTRLGL